MTRLEQFKRMLLDYVPQVISPSNLPIPGDPWRNYKITCGECDGSWIQNNLAGEVGVICPHCGYYDKDFKW